MTTIREHLKRIVNPPLMHEDELIDFMHAHAKAALHLLDASAPQCLDDPPGVSHRLVPDPQENT